MTLTETLQQLPSEPHTARTAHDRHPVDMPPPHRGDWSFARVTGPAAIAAGVLMVTAQCLWLPFDARDYEVTSTDVVFQTGTVLYLVGFCVLLLAAAGIATRQSRSAGRFGLVAGCSALLGTMLLGGDLWFEAFVVPWLASGAHSAALDADPSASSGLGAITSYASFAVGWALLGIASFRARVFPRSTSVVLAITGLIGFNALLAPFGIPLGLTMVALGIWVVRHPAAT